MAFDGIQQTDNTNPRAPERAPTNADNEVYQLRRSQSPGQGNLSGNGSGAPQAEKGTASSTKPEAKQTEKPGTNGAAEKSSEKPNSGELPNGVFVSRPTTPMAMPRVC